MVAALQIKHSRQEHPRDYYWRLRHAYFHGRNTPGLEENSSFKSLFLHNLHPCIRPQVKIWAHLEKPSMHEMKIRTQIVWETVVQSKTRIIEPASATSKEVLVRPPVTKDHPQNRPKGGDKRPQRDTERSRRVHHLRRDRHSVNRSCRRPYAEILAQTPDQPVYASDDDNLISDYNSDNSHSPSDNDSVSEYFSPYSDSHCYSPEPQVRRNLKPRSSRFF